ncbi:MAG: PAS domain S-box protein, partial [Desulfamplus sp.]|nr:PAS domain S-box protein [Desulfamplus sp.]
MVADSRNFAKQVIEVLESSEFTDTPFVLIVEDSPTIAGILKRAFESKGYCADIALNAYDAARYFSNTKYDVAIIDYHLPDNMGDSLLDSFHNQNKDCVYLMMTTDPKPELALDWIKRGASAYIRKPFEPEYLIELCTKARRERSLLLVEDLLELRTQELKASEEKYRLLIDTANEGVWAMDNDHITTYVNKAMADMLGYTTLEMFGKKVEEFFFPEDNSFHNERMTIRHKGNDEIYERRFRHKDGSSVWTLVSAKALKDYQGNFAGSFAMFTNITERKKAEENYQILFREMLNGFALHEIICDENNNPIDYRFLAVNPAFERMTGL